MRRRRRWLDLLVNNAGIFINRALPSALAVDDLRKTFETNVFGVVATTNAFLPPVRLSPSPRIVNVSSGLGSVTFLSDPTWPFYGVNVPAYQASKSALDSLTAMYAKELRDTAFTVNAICPGYRATDLAGEGVNASNGAADPAGGANIVVKMALLGPDGSTGGYFAHDGSVDPW